MSLPRPHLLIILLVGLPFVWVGVSEDPASTPRLLLLQLFNIWGMITFLKHGGWRCYSRTQWFAIGAFALLMLLPAAFAVNREAAVFGWLRMLAMLQVMLWSGYLLSQTRISLTIAAVICGGLVALIGITQVFRLDIFPYQQHYPPAVTFLNKNVAGELVAAILPLALGYLILAANRLKIALAATACGCMVFFVIMAESRTSWVASFLTLIVVLVFVLYRRTHRSQVVALGLGKTAVRLTFVVIVVTALLGARQLAHLPVQTAISDELRTLVNLGAYQNKNLNTVRVRLSMYLNSLHMLRDHTLTGVGLKNFGAHYPKYHNRVMETPSFTYRVGPDTMHNDILQLAVETGLPGLASYCFLMLLVFAAPRWNDLPETFLIHTVLRASVLILLIESCFSFSLHRTTPAVWFWVGCGVLMARVPKQEPTRTHPVLFLSGGLGALLLLFALKPVFDGERLLKSAKAEADQGHWQAAETLLNLAHDTYPGSPKPLDWLTTLSLQRGNNDHALRVADRFLERNPYQSNAHLRRALAYHYQGKWEPALAALDRAFIYGPPTPRMHLLRGLILRALGRDGESETHLEQAYKKGTKEDLDLDPTIAGTYSHWF